MTTSSDTSTTPAASQSRDSHRTPAMRQYARFKRQHPDCVLFFRMGDFYEMFEEDAKLVHRVLGLTLTQRTEGVPMAGVPHHAVETYLRRMIEAGYRVAVCDQIQDPKEAKGIVDRAVTRVVTPGTLVDAALLDESTPNQLAAIQFVEPGDNAAAVAAVAELSTGAFSLHTLPAGRVADELARIGPSELLYAETANGAVPPRIEVIRTAALTARPAWTYRMSEARDCLKEHYGVATLSGFGISEDDPTIGPAGALLRYLQETQASPAGSDDGRLGHLRPPKLHDSDQYLTIDSTSLHSLEILRTMRSGTVAGSLLSIFHRCHTAMGKRLLRRWLCFPLRDIDSINVRQRTVAALVDYPDLRTALVKQIGNVQDVARIVGRVATARVTPRDVVALGRSIGMIPDLIEALADQPAFAATLDRARQLSGSLSPLGEAIQSRCVDSPPPHLREGGLFRDGIDQPLDEARHLQRDANTWLAQYQQQLIKQTGIPSLKVGYNKVFGYYIEITHRHSENVPATFSRKQTLKNAERYITSQLKEFEEKVTSAQTRAIEREAFLFDRLSRDIAKQAEGIGQFADLVAELDVVLCFAEISARHAYVRPTIVPEPVIDINAGRHPVLDRTLGERFVPNDCALCADDDRETTEDPSSRSRATLALITGPNMAGKSTYIRQNALIVLLAHTGCFVPAETATIGLTDRIFTRIGASDELHAGQSTFMVEMTETANILHHATEHSLVILDEIGRGTSTLDGLSLAWAIAETLAQRGCRTLFATHYHELTVVADRLGNVQNLHVSVREWGEQIIFLYRILPGRTDRSYGIHVAKLAGIPPQTVRRASQLLDTLAVQSESTPETALSGASASPSGPDARQLGLFTEYLQHPLVQELGEIDLSRLSPLEAFDLLRNYQARAREKPTG
ncbi:MAG: DNA mismatch repair protein MutS [Phycisphaerales bacterium]